MILFQYFKIKSFILTVLFVGIFLTLGKDSRASVLDTSLDAMIDVEAKVIDIKETITLRGESDRQLTTGITTQIPYSRYEIENVRFGDLSLPYDINEQVITIDFEDFYLKNGEEEDITISYKVYDQFHDYYGHLNTRIFKPQNETYRYSINISNAQDYEEYFYSVGTDLTGVTDKDIFLVWDTRSQEGSNIRLNYECLEENDFYPILSENIHQKIYLNERANTEYARKDEENNYFINCQEAGRSYVNLAYSRDIVNSELSSSTITIPDINIKSDNINELIEEILNQKQPSNKTSLSNIDEQNLTTKKSLNNLEYAVYVSAILHENGFNNEIIYGISGFDLFKDKLYFMLRIENEDGNVSTFDPYLVDLLELRPISFDLEIPFIPFGKITKKNIKDINQLGRLNDLDLEFQENVDLPKEQGINNIAYDLVYYDDGSINLNVINDSNYFSWLEDISDQSIGVKFEKILIPPNSVYTENFDIEKSGQFLEVKGIFRNNQDETLPFDLRLESVQRKEVTLSKYIFYSTIAFTIVMPLILFFRFQLPKKLIKNYRIIRIRFDRRKNMM